jgi:large subunit ribosomal protein L10
LSIIRRQQVRHFGDKEPAEDDIFFTCCLWKNHRFFMESKREKKKKIVESLKEKISKQKLMVFFDFSGIKTKDLFELRKELKKSESELKITKKSLAEIAFKKSGFEIDLKKIKVQLALVFGFGDEISSAKIIYQFSQKNPNLKILGGIFQKEIVGPEKIFDLAKLLTREELLTKLVSSISAPISNFVFVLRENLRNFVYILSRVKVNQ